MEQLPFGGHLGVLEVEKVGQGAFKATYGIVILGFKVEASRGNASGTIKAKGYAKNVPGQIWRPEHIPGRVVFTDMGFTAAGGGTGKSGSVTLMTCHGGGNGRPAGALGFNFTGLHDLIPKGVGGKVSFTYYHGWIFDGQSNGGEIHLDDLPSEDQHFPYGVHSAVGPLHFPINGAGLTPDACALLEIFACCDLPVLSSKGLKLHVHGYADQPDESFNNNILSRNRAISVYNYLKNILEDDLAAPDLKDMPTEKEERDEAAKPKYKTSPYVISDPSVGKTVIIKGHGAPPAAKGSKVKPQYDPELRRVDLEVNGEARLSLRRMKDK